jgi:hypothetical protein
LDEEIITISFLQITIKDEIIAFPFCYFEGSKTTLPLFTVSDSILTSYLLLPSVTTINAVFGGMVPRLSAYIVTIFSGAFLSRVSVNEMGLSDNR